MGENRAEAQAGTLRDSRAPAAAFTSPAAQP
jgi:hypothetical protein